MSPLCALVLLLGMLPDGGTPERDELIGKRVEDFRLQDYRGAWHTLGDLGDRKLVVLAFLGTECPLSKLYGARLAELDRAFAPRGVAFLGINANRQDSITEIAHHARVHAIDFPVLKDVGNAFADRLGAQRTPEVFVLDADHVVRYHGRIDDQYGIGYSRPSPTRRDLADALDELLAGKPVAHPAVAAAGCLIGRVKRSEAKGRVTYTKDVAPILNRRCAGCHRPGEIAPFALTSYDEVVGWADMIREVLEQQRMPPWLANSAYGSFANDARMPDDEKRLIREWAENGAPQGDPRDLPAPPQFVEGWRIPAPDLVLHMPEPFTVPASGTVEYQYFAVDPGFQEDRWVRAAEARPGNRSVVHHMVLIVQPPDSRPVAQTGGLGNELLAVTAPGMPPQVLRDGMAKRIPAGSRLVFQMHYTPNGSAQTDQSSVGLVFADAKTVRREVRGGMALNFQFRIPPHAKDYPAEAEHRFGQDTLLVSLFPHMNLRGRSYLFDAIYPDGSQETLLDVPRYDFNWQNEYVLAEPKLMPEGTRLHCTGHFDNSEENLSNPDPDQAVTFGEQTWEEMLVGYFDAALAEQDLTLGAPRVRELPSGDREVTFRYTPREPAQAVYLAGTFNEWDKTALKMDGPDADGTFQTRLVLKPASYQYKFLIDGEKWRQDPGNPRQVGGYNNSLIELAAPGKEETAPLGKLTAIDLDAFTNQKLSADFSELTAGNNLAELPRGDQTLAGVRFHIGEGMIQLGSKLKTERPMRVEAVPVGRSFARLHILHATEFGSGPEGNDHHVADGGVIARYTVHYEDGSVETIPIAYGTDARDWWFSALSPGVTEGKVAWEGSNAFARRYRAGVRLYLKSWTNPKPEAKVVSIDLASGDTAAAPFCVALTTEEKE